MILAEAISLVACVGLRASALCTYECMDASLQEAGWHMPGTWARGQGKLNSVMAPPLAGGTSGRHPSLHAGGCGSPWLPAGRV